MKLLLIEPMHEPREIEIEKGLSALQEAVGGSIQAVYPFDDPVALIVNDDGKIDGLPYNRVLRDEEGQIYDILAGNILVAGLGEEDFADLSPDLMHKYMELFRVPEQFLNIDGAIIVVSCPVDPQT